MRSRDRAIQHAVSCLCAGLEVAVRRPTAEFIGGVAGALDYVLRTGISFFSVPPRGNQEDHRLILRTTEGANVLDPYHGRLRPMRGELDWTTEHRCELQRARSEAWGMAQVLIHGLARLGVDYQMGDPQDPRACLGVWLLEAGRNPAWPALAVEPVPDRWGDVSEIEVRAFVNARAVRRWLLNRPSLPGDDPWLSNFLVWSREVRDHAAGPRSEAETQLGLDLSGPGEW